MGNWEVLQIFSFQPLDLYIQLSIREVPERKNPQNEFTMQGATRTLTPNAFHPPVFARLEQVVGQDKKEVAKSPVPSPVLLKASGVISCAFSLRR